MWNYKYIPKKSSDIIGNIEQVNKIKLWLSNIKNNIPNNYKGLYINGPNGIGKKTIINVLLKEYNFNIIEFDNVTSSSQFKEKLLMDSNYTNLNLFNNKYKHTIIIINDLDSLLQYIKTIINDILGYVENKEKKYNEVYPIICISSKKIKKITTTFENIVFNKNTKEDLYVLLNKICCNENITLDSEFKNMIIEYCKQYNTLIYILEDIHHHYITKNKNITKKDIETILYIFSNPKIDTSLYKSVSDIFNTNIKCEDILDYYYIDKAYTPIYIHANYNKYLHYNCKNTFFNKLDKMEHYYDTLIDSSLIEDYMKENNTWEMDKYVGILSCQSANIQLNSNIKKKKPLKYTKMKNSPIFSKLNYQYYNLKLTNNISRKLNIGYMNFHEYTFKIYKYFILKKPNINEYKYFLKYLKESNISYTDFDKSIKLSYLYESYRGIYTNKKKKELLKVYNHFIL